MSEAQKGSGRCHAFAATLQAQLLFKITAKASGPVSTCFRGEIANANVLYNSRESMAPVDAKRERVEHAHR
jgi:hypothetical protein